jgi:hypothetical protein
MYVGCYANSNFYCPAALHAFKLSCSFCVDVSQTQENWPQSKILYAECFLRPTAYICVSAPRSLFWTFLAKYSVPLLHANESKAVKERASESGPVSFGAKTPPTKVHAAEKHVLGR